MLLQTVPAEQANWIYLACFLHDSRWDKPAAKQWCSTTHRASTPHMNAHAHHGTMVAQQHLRPYMPGVPSDFLNALHSPSWRCVFRGPRKTIEIARATIAQPRFTEARGFWLAKVALSLRLKFQDSSS